MKFTPAADDLLYDFELQVARRADELAHEPTMQGRTALEVWLEAERQTANPFSGYADSALFKRKA